MISFTFESQRSVHWTSVTWCFVLLAALCYSNGLPHQKTVKMEDPLPSASESSTMPDTSEQLKTMVADLGSLLDAGDGAVVTLVARNTRLAVHRAVLAAGSPVLAAMFRPGTLAASSTEAAMPGVEGPVLRQLVAFLYTGRAPQLPSMAPQLLAAAEKYGVSALRDASEQQVLEHLDVESVAAAAVVAVRHSRHSLTKAVIAFIRAHILEVLPTKGWAETMINHPREAVQITLLLAEPPEEVSATATSTAALTSAAADSTPTSTAAPAATTATTDSTPTTPDAPAATTAHSDSGQTAAPLPTAGHHIPPPRAAAVSHLQGLSAKQKGSRLIQAAKEGRVPELRALLTAGASVEARGELEETALHWAAGLKHVEATRCLLQAGAEVDARDDRQSTPLDWTAWNGNAAAVRLLLAAGADASASNRDGRTPLHWATLNGHAEVAATLLQAGADRAARDKQGKTALDLARQNNRQQLVQLLQ